MEASPQIWRRTCDRFEQLTRRPLLLLTIVLVCNAIMRPYSGLTHDACLYGAQVANRVDGSFANDLYLRYGSQDSYSAFSTVAQPLVKLVGLEPGFFLLYLFSTGLFFFGLLRITQRIVKSPVHAVFALLLVACSPIWFGGLLVFHANETFLTPRILASALVLIACERMLAGRMLWALLAILAGMALHPIMAFAGLLVWLGISLFNRFAPSRVAMILFGGMGLALIIVSIRPIGARLFGVMDPAWHEAAQSITYYACISQWLANDWMRIATALGLIGFSAFRHPDLPTRKLCAALGLVGLAAILGSFFAERLPYALLFQGQPFRALWLVQLLAIPIGFHLCAALWESRHAPQQLVAIAILYSFVFPATVTAFCAAGCLGAAVLGHAVLFTSSTGKANDRPANRSQLLAGSALFAFLALTLPVLISVSLLALRKGEAARDFVEPMFWYRVAFLTLGPGLSLMLAACLSSILAARLLATRNAVCWTAVAFATIQTGFFFAPRVLNQRLTSHKDIQFVKSALPIGDQPTVHWTNPSPKVIWFKLHASSFFTWQQTAGSLFNRETAMEAVRRARLVAPVDLGAHDAAAWSIGRRELEAVKRLYGVADSDAITTAADVLSVCHEEELDFLVSRHEIENMYRATNGRWFIYDCKAVRESGWLPSSMARR